MAWYCNGGGIKIVHFGDIVIGHGAVIGNNCTIYNGVTLGLGIYGPNPMPKVGNNVVFCTGCKVIGGVTIGNNVVVGANAVVTKDIPSNSVAVGIPAKVISNNSELAKEWLRKKF